MQIGKQFNTLSPEEYYYYIDNRKNYTDFNELGLFRSIFENEKLNELGKIKVRDYIQKKMPKVLEFMQVRHPGLYTKLFFLWKNYTKGDEDNLWRIIRWNQEKILNSKRIKHRNFWNYSKHNCWIDTCPLNGMMVQQWSWFCELEMRPSNNNRKEKSKIIKQERKESKKIVENYLIAES